jgi:hypothetical protein
VSQKIRVTTRNDLFEKRKQEHLQAAIGSRNEQPVPVNGCAHSSRSASSMKTKHADELHAWRIAGC